MRRRLASEAAGGGGGFAHQAGEGGQVKPDVSQEDEGLAPRRAIDRQALEMPTLKVGVAALDSVASAVVEAFPGRSADRDVAYQTDGTIIEALADVDDLAVRSVVRLNVRALIRRIGDIFHSKDGRAAIEAGLSAEPLVALAFGVEAIGGEGKPIGANGTTFVIVAAHGPLGFVIVRLVSAEIDGAPGMQARVDGMEKESVTETSVTSHSIDTEGRIEAWELAQ
jgi:hypothetical protein